MSDYAAWKRAEQEEAVKADPGDVMPLLPASDVAVISIDCCRDGALILSGSNDSTARVFCVRSVQVCSTATLFTCCSPSALYTLRLKTFTVALFSFAVSQRFVLLLAGGVFYVEEKA